MLPFVSPTPLASVREPFDDRDSIFEPKWDGSRALAYIDGHRCRVSSRNGHIYKSRSVLAEELAQAVQCQTVIDDVLVCVSSRTAAVILTTCRSVATGRTSWRSTAVPERQELFEARRDNAQHRVRPVRPELAL